MLAAGGTGGHLFPAFALAEELGRRGYAVDLATDLRGDRYGTGFPARKVYPIHAATVAGRSPVALARTGMTLARGTRDAMGIIRATKPAAVVGFGGYPSFPPLVAAALLGVATALHEQNAVLGRANRMLARRVSAVATSFAQVKFAETVPTERVHLTGNPVRSVVLEAARLAYRPAAGADRFRLLVFGGSQGARFFSDRLPEAVARLDPDERGRLSIVQQCREEDLARVADAYRRLGVEAHTATFFRELPTEMANAHLVIGRAGASTIAELTVIGRPSLLVPLPHALDNDQRANAAALAESGGAWSIDQNELSAERLAHELRGLMGDPGRLTAAAAAARSQGRPDAVARLADLVEAIMRR